MTVGAVLSGAYAGDKQSPLSDTTNLAAGVTNTDLYTHIRRMRTGTAVAFGLAVLGFLALGLRASGEIPVGRIADIQGALGGTYAITLLAFIPLVVTFGLALRGYAPRCRPSSPACSPARSRRFSCRGPVSSPRGTPSCTAPRRSLGPIW